MKNRLVATAILAALVLTCLSPFAQAQEVWYKGLWNSFSPPTATPSPTPSATPTATPSPTPSATPNQAPSKKYLNLGADPQNADRQPIAGKEEVVVIDEDICDPAWGTGSKNKIDGCYPKNSAVIRHIETGFVTAMYKCGNEPSQKHKVSGKIVPTTTPNLAAAVERVISNTKVLGEMELKVGGTVEVHHSGAVKLEIALPPAPSPTPTPSVRDDKGHTNRNIVLSTLGVSLVGGIVYAITRDDKHSLNGKTKDVTKCVTTSGKYTCK